MRSAVFTKVWGCGVQMVEMASAKNIFIVDETKAGPPLLSFNTVAGPLPAC